MRAMPSLSSLKPARALLAGVVVLTNAPVAIGQAAAVARGDSLMASFRTAEARSA